jgi:proteasome accessory factor C
VAELEDGSVIVERGFAGIRYLVRDVLKEAGDAVVLEPDDTREAVRQAAEAIGAATASLSR